MVLAILMQTGSMSLIAGDNPDVQIESILDSCVGDKSSAIAFKYYIKQIMDVIKRHEKHFLSKFNGNAPLFNQFMKDLEDIQGCTSILAIQKTLEKYKHYLPNLMHKKSYFEILKGLNYRLKCTGIPPVTATQPLSKSEETPLPLQTASAEPKVENITTQKSSKLEDVKDFILLALAYLKQRVQHITKRN